jgi:hypothetical protein
MTELQAECSGCAREGYDECLCTFCANCGEFGHTRDNCTKAMCLQCNGRHAANECSLDEYQISEDSELPATPDSMNLSELCDGSLPTTTGAAIRVR